MEKKILTCIGCPMGCELTVELNGCEVAAVSGYTCKRGESYAKKEVTHPTRIVTTTVRVKNGTCPVVPVKTKTDLPKDRMFACIRELKDLTVDAPVSAGQIVLKDAAGTGVEVVAVKEVGVLDGGNG